MLKNNSEIKIDLAISSEMREELVKLAERYLGYDSLYIWNANINGIIIQLRTNDAHIEDFFKENWYPASLERSLRPHGVIYAISGISESGTSIYYHSESKTGIIFNSSHYEPVRSLTLGMITDIAEEGKKIHFFRGALIDINGEGIAFLGEPNSGVSTHSFLLLQHERARIHSAELVYTEHLGGEKGRFSTFSSERKFYLKTNIAKINPRIKELLPKCKRENKHFILDPFWIGGEEKYIDTTRIKVIFLLLPDKKEEYVAKRLDPKKAIDLLTNTTCPFYNPHRLVWNDARKSLQVSFWSELLNYAAIYKVNTAKPIFEVQRKLLEIIRTREYTRPLIEVGEKPSVTISQLLETKELLKEISELYNRYNVSHPTALEIRKAAEQYGTRTVFGNYNFVSTVKNRSASLTVYVGSQQVMQKQLNSRQKEILANLPKTISEVHDYLKKAPFVCTERTMGDNNIFTPRCTLFVSIHRKEMIRLAHMINQTLLPPKPKEAALNDPHLYLVYIPEWQEKDRQILVFPELGLTYVLGSDYYGEAKKGFLRMAMWIAKTKYNMLGLHAGAKIIKAKDKASGKIKRYSMVIFGLTGTGKTTHTCHDHFLDRTQGEGIEIVQDDFIALREDLSALGTERGFYLKTEGVTPETQPLIYQAVTKPDAIFENVMVDYLGNVFFEDDTLTGNGRGIMQRDDFGEFKSASLNLPPITEVDGMIIAFITRRNTVVPIVSKLTIEQAAAAFMLGESIETTASDPKRAGESVREVGTNPFIIGDEAEEGNIFYRFIKQYPDKVQCYLLNTGGVGEIIETMEDGTKVVRQKVTRVEIPEMAIIIREIARGSIEWVKEPYFNTLVPKEVEGIDIHKFDLNRYYTQAEIEYYVNTLKKERIEYLEKFSKLDPAIVNAIK